jgi:hypothetical protein
MDPTGTGNVYASRGDAAAVSPQSSPGSGNTPQGGWQADPNSAIGKLIRGDLPGAFSAGMRALLGQQGLPEDQNMAGKGTPPPPPTPIPTETLSRPPGRGDIEAQRISPDRAFRPPIPVPGTFGSTQLAAGDLGARPGGRSVPMDPFTAGAPPSGAPPFDLPPRSQDRVPQTAPGPQSRAPADRGGAAAAVAPQQYPGNTPQHSVANTLSAAGAQPNAIAGIMANIQAESGWSRNSTSPVGARGLVQFSPTGEELSAYKSWLTQKGLLKDPGSPQNQMNFLAERLKTAYPQTWARMNAAKSPAQAAEIFAREYERPGANDLNRRIIQFRNQGVPEVGQQLGGGTPRFGDYYDRGSAAAAANIGKYFPRGDWRQFMGNARPSTNVEDARGRLAANAINPRLGPQGPDATWNPSPEQLRQEVGERFNPNDPMTRDLMGSDRARMRDDILKNLTPDEYMQWLGQMREQGGQLLRERWQSR